MLKVVTHVEDGLGAVRKTIVAETAEDWKNLQVVFQRATNLWPDAPPSVKAIADIVTGGDITTSGVVLQDYDTQDTSPGSKERREQRLKGN